MQWKIAVRNLVEFILRKGDLDNRTISNHTAQEGAKIHRKLQKAAGDTYQKEVFLREETSVENDKIIVEGRADGIFKEEDLWVIDEIKTSEVRFEDLDESQVELYYAQAKVYAYIYCLQNELSNIQVRLTYYQTNEDKVTYKKRTYDWCFLKDFFEKLLKEYHKWMVFQAEWRQKRNTTLTNITFPYTTFRKGQRELASAAYKTLRTKQELFVEAPTGVGKTISTLFPTLKALGENHADRLFYLTAKTITRQAAEDALATLAAEGAKIKSITITAKDKISFPEEQESAPENNPYAIGYYDRVNEGVWDILHHENQITRPIIEAYAKKHTLSPFELSLDVSLFCDVIIADYNYLFDPTVYLRRFFEDNNESYYFLVDEAHNLVNRSREMYSADIKRNTFESALKSFPKNSKKILKSLRDIDNEFASIEEIAQQNGWTFHHQKAPAETLNKLLLRFSGLAKEWLAANPENQNQEEILNLYFEVLHFLKISDFYDDTYESTIEIIGDNIKIRQFCMAPAHFLNNMLHNAKASLLFSASLTPLPYYQEVLGGDQEALRYRLPSPFPAKNQQVFIASYIQTTYKKRGDSYHSIAQAIADAVYTKKGNYLVFFPSYKYLDDCYEIFRQRFPDINVVLQDTQMNEQEREDFLAKFVENPKQSLVGFCVLGGIFSEGIDLKGTRLIGSIVVGVGLPQKNHEQELIKDYFNAKEGQGFEYAYQLPGMNKVLQAAGRVIRDANDKGIVLLLDQRFTSNIYRSLFPSHWQNIEICHKPEQLKQGLKTFWQEFD
ncbi:helicase C-terminal domain-containing protein [Tetragenococcus muriaticus]|uniref:helicase C-terminal domain-containing protein n=1 Tax=Tetragenococcus muriaticus TaxID=64642 RepID=UPI0004072067|nr:helicase C-terminal domain-containing protein [Tetragenococcus muriaticus]GMA47105.1 ATP-dependent helicase [Tetragenococcus muriaticus]